MAVMPGVEYKPINYSGVSRLSAHDIVCAHTIVGYAPASAAHFSTAGNGHIWQSRDTIYQSAANLNGNYRVIAIENADHGAEFPPWNTNDGHAVPSFSSAQCESIAQILAWCHHTHGIPLEIVPDSKPGRRGVAYHRQGIDGNFSGYAYGGRVPGGELWSSSYGKVCPGDRRITQLIDTILPRAKFLAGQSVEEDETMIGAYPYRLPEAPEGQREQYEVIPIIPSDGALLGGGPVWLSLCCSFLPVHVHQLNFYTTDPATGGAVELPGGTRAGFQLNPVRRVWGLPARCTSVEVVYHSPYPWSALVEFSTPL